jgi:DNA-binding transcriptional LysR family regulator
MTTDDLSRGLKRRELDIAICYALPELATHQGVEESLVTEQPFALVIPAPAWVHGKPSVRVLKSLLYARLPHHFAHRAVVAGEKWLTQHQVTPRQTIECALGTEIVSYAAAGLGYGFLPALWSTVADASVVFAPMTNFAATAKIAAYSLQHVAPWVTQLREDLSVGARAALQDFAPSRGR